MTYDPRSIVAFLLLTLSLASPAVAASEEDEFFKFESMPKFDAPAKDPVLLRYKLKSGQLLKMNVTTAMDMTIHADGQKLKMLQTMGFDCKASVTDVDSDGNMSVVVKITRFQMKMSGLQELNFDSDAEKVDDAFKPLMAMINVGIPCKMSSLGELLETDLEPMRLALRRAGDAAFAKELEKSTDKMFEGAFVQMSKEPIKAGETYKAGTIVEDQMKMEMSYKILSVSGDGKKALMEPIAKMEINKDAFGEADVTIKKNRIGGWILHDVERGLATDAEARVYMLMDISAEGQKASAEMKLTMKMKASVAE